MPLLHATRHPFPNTKNRQAQKTFLEHLLRRSGFRSHLQVVNHSRLRPIKGSVRGSHDSQEARYLHEDFVAKLLIHKRLDDHDNKIKPTCHSACLVHWQKRSAPELTLKGSRAAPRTKKWEERRNIYLRRKGLYLVLYQTHDKYQKRVAKKFVWKLVLVFGPRVW